MRIHYLQHVPFENPGTIIDWARKKGHSLTGTHLYNHETVPAVEQFECLVIMGGPMNIYEEEKYPWLRYEKQFIKEAIEAGKIVLGICLGAQLIADVLGGKVTKNPEGEIGWLPVKFNKEALKSPLSENFPETVCVFQWHNDTFSSLGSGSVCIAGSQACKHQAFVYKERVVGFQFHLECTESGILSLVKHCADELVSGDYIQNERQIRDGMAFLQPVNRLMEEFLDRLEAYDQKQG